MKLYDFNVVAQDGSNVSLSDFKGQVVLIVNTATGCQFTPQYGELEDLYVYFEDDNFEILDFPCNQFAGQAPGSDEEIHSFCTLRFGTTFKQFSKIDVNGENAIPLYKWLRENTKFKGFGAGFTNFLLKISAKKADKHYKDNSDIKWNFTKFLIDSDGNIVERYEPTEPIEKIKAKIQELISKE